MITIEYRVGSTLLSSRRRANVPVRGDFVLLAEGLFEVHQVAWLEERVAAMGFVVVALTPCQFQAPCYIAEAAK